MTKLLDLLESYLAWRKVGPQADTSMGYLRIDGSTSLEDRYAFLAPMRMLCAAEHVLICCLQCLDDSKAYEACEGPR